MNPQAIIFIGSNTTGSGVMFFKKAVELGFQPLFLHNDDVSSLKIAQAVPQTISTPTNLGDYEEVKRTIDRLGAQYDIRGVVTSSEYCAETVAKTAQALGLPGANPNAIQRCRNKKTQRDVLRATGIAQPRYATFRTKEDVRELFTDPIFQKGAIIKPISGSGSVGVYYLSNAADFGAIEKQFQNDALATHGNLEFLLEEFVEGDEFSVEIFNGRAFGITRKYLSPIPRFLEIGHDFPANSSLSYSLFVALQVSAEKAAAALGLVWGAVHVELKALPDGTVQIIEVNPRLAGGSLPRLFELVGFDAIRATVQASVGAQVVPWINSQYRNASIRFLIPPKTGVLKTATVKPLDNCEIAFYKHLGERVDKTGDFRERLGHVIAFGVNEDETRKCAEALVRSSIIKTE